MYHKCPNPATQFGVLDASGNFLCQPNTNFSLNTIDNTFMSSRNNCANSQGCGSGPLTGDSMGNCYRVPEGLVLQDAGSGTYNAFLCGQSHAQCKPCALAQGDQCGLQQPSCGSN